MLYATSTDFAGEIKYLSFEIIPKDTVGQKQIYCFDFTKFVDRTKLIKKKTSATLHLRYVVE